MIFTIITFSLIVLELYTKRLKNYQKIISEILLLLALLFAGFSVVKIKDATLSKNHYINYPFLFEKEIKMVLKIDSPIKIKEKKVTVNGELVNYYSNNLFNPIKGKILLYLPLDSSSSILLPGDLICFKSQLYKFKTLGNPHEFNYPNYLKSKGIFAQSFINDSSKWIYFKSILSINRYATIIRNHCIRIFKKSGLASNNLAIASALTFGYKDDLNNRVKGVFSKTGAMHILAVSGLHIGIIYIILNTLLKLIKVPYKVKWINDIIVLIIIWCYAITTGLSPSILRASAMLSFFIIANIFNITTNIFNIIFATAFLILLINPLLILDVSFQLSFLALFGIIYIHPLIYKKIVFKNYLIDKIWTISVVSIAAQIATFPLSIYYFHQFPNLFLISNIIAIPLVFIIIILGILTLALSFNHSMLFYIGKLNSFSITLLINTLSKLDNLAFSNFEGLFISKSETILFYILIASLILFVNYKYHLFQKISVIILFLVISLDLIEDFRLKNQKKIIIYNIPNHIAVDLISGNRHHFIADQDLLNNNKMINFYIENNWNFLDLRAPNIIDLKKIKFPTIQWEGKTIAFVKENRIYNKNIDIAIINEIPKKSIQLFKNMEILKFIQNKSGFKTDQLINQELINNNCSVKDVNVNGAYIYRLQ